MGTCFPLPLFVRAVLTGPFQDENYGAISAKQQQPGAQVAPSKLRHVLSDPLVLSLGLASTMFEGSMYLFVFFWGPALRAARAAAAPASAAAGDLPYGIIFAAFMAAVLAASLAFGLVTARRLARHTSLLLGLLAASELVFYALGASAPGSLSEQATFWLFCLFEACVGLYWPSMGVLKGRLVDDGVRAQVYGFMRIPLNVFVVAALLLTGDGEAFAPVFANCSKLLLAACGAVLAMMLNQDGLP